MKVDKAVDDSGAAGAGTSLAALAQISFPSLDPMEIVASATDGLVTLGPCRIEASYCAVDATMTLCPPTRPERPELTDALRRSDWQGDVALPDGDWGRAFPLSHREVIHGCLVVGADTEPEEDHLLLMKVLAQRAGAALACADLHRRDVRRARQLEESNEDLARAVQRLKTRTHAHELLEAALAAGADEQGIVDALHRLTGLPVCVEDRFGNLRAWSGPGQPARYPKSKPSQRDRFLHALSTQAGPMRSKDRVSVLIRPHAEILGVVSLIGTDAAVDEDVLFALRYASSVLGVKLSHQRSLAEMHLNLRRELVDDLVAGTDADGGYARADALGYDLRRPHRAVVIRTGSGVSKTDITAVSRAAANLHLNHLVSHQGGLVVLLADGHPQGDALHSELSRQLGHSSSAIGIGSSCDALEGIPQSYSRARRALNIRLNSAQPWGSADFDELGFYHLVDAAHSVGVAEEYVRQWLGPLIDYDAAKKADLVHTLSHYLECGGNYDESAATLHVHRSTLRYRLGRIADLTGLDLRKVDTRFNLHAATRVWLFLEPDR